MMDKKNVKVIITISMLFIVLYAITYTYEDVECITKWAITFLDVVREGRISGYADAILESGIGSNYSVSLNIIDAIWLLPVYFVQMIKGSEVDLVYYCTWLKVPIALAALGCAVVTSRIGEKFDLITEDNRALFYVVFLMSPLVLISEMLKGQVDSISLFFFLLGFLSMLDGKYEKMAVFVSVSLLIKGLVIMYFIPVLLLVLSDKIGKLIKTGLISISLPIMNSLITGLFFPGYSKMSMDRELSLDHLEFFFKKSFLIGQTPVFLCVYVLICLFAMYKCVTQTVKTNDFILYPFVVFLSFLVLNKWYDQYLLYGLPFMILILMKYGSKMVFYISNIMITYGLWITIPFKSKSITNYLYWDGLVNHIFRRVPNYLVLQDIFYEKFPMLDGRMAMVGAAIYTAGLMFPLLLLLHKKYNKTEETEYQYIHLVKASYPWLVMLPAAVFLVLTYKLAFV